MRRVVDLPAPLGPRKATSSPWSMVRSSPRTASTVFFCDVKRLVRPRVTITGPVCWFLVMTTTLGIKEVSL